MSRRGKRLILVAGNIGAGKTTLTQRIAGQLGWRAGHEAVNTNPFLADFYTDMQQWAFHLQVFFLGDRADMHHQLAHDAASAIIDRSIYEDAHIFARALLELGNMTPREFNAYRRVYDQVVAGLPRPDLLLYLDASVPTLLDRIRSRNRAIEAGITADYLKLLNTFYEEWIADFDICPVLTIPANNMNFVTNDRHITIIIDRINQKLAGHDRVIFPQDLRN